MKHSYFLRSALTALMGSAAMLALALPPKAYPPAQGNMRPGAVRIMDNLTPGRLSSSDELDGGKREEARQAYRNRVNPAGFAATQESTRRMKQAAEKLCKVTCVFSGEHRPMFEIYHPGFFEGRSYEVWEELEEEDTYYFEVPAGTYDICAHFYGSYGEYSGFGLIVHEDVEVKEDITVEFSRNEATTVQLIRPLLRNGEPANVPVGISLDEEPWYQLDYTDATAEYINYDYYIFREGCEAIESGYYANGVRDPGETSDLYFITNEMSDKYHFVVNTFIQTYSDPHEYELATTVISGVTDRVVNTYNKDFVKYPFPEFVETPLYKELGCERARSAISGHYWIDDVQIGGGGVYAPELRPDVYVTTQPTSLFDLKTVAYSVGIQYEKDIMLEFDDPYTLRGEMNFLPAWYNGEEWEYINQNHSECDNWAYQHPESGPVLEYPGLEPYSFTSSQLTQPFGNSAPVLVWMTQTRTVDGNPVISISPQAWVGRYGEVRNCDDYSAELKIENGEGEMLFDNTEGGSLNEWIYTYFSNPHDGVPLKITSLDTNILVDNEVKGFTKSTVEIDENREDRITPTPQMLIFKNVSGEITDRFNTSKDGIIEFSAGDFIWNETEEDWYYSVEEAEVKVEYAPYGEDAWQPIEVEQVPEYFYMPGFGYFYRGSLECVDMPSSNGWYDLRMTLTDKAGNRTVEHISPAFKIGTGSGVDGVTIDGLKVWASDGIIRTNASYVSSITAYALDGALIASGNSSTLYVGGYTGALLVHLTTPDGTTTHKLLLR